MRPLWLLFANKLRIVEALDVLDDRTIQSLRGLNKVRNLCAHTKDHQFTMREIDIIYRSLGDEYTMLRQTHHVNINILLNETLGAICRDAMYSVFCLKNAATKTAAFTKIAAKSRARASRGVRVDRFKPLDTITPLIIEGTVKEGNDENIQSLALYVPLHCRNRHGAKSRNTVPRDGTTRVSRELRDAEVYVRPIAKR